MSLLPSVGTKEFNKLHYKEKLFILSLYYHDKSQYTEVCGLPPKELEYVDDSVFDLFKLPREPTVTKELPISFVEGTWCAYISYYKPTWWEEGFSPVDDLGLDHRRIFSIQLFNFPLIALDRKSSHILRWLLTQPHKTRGLSDVFYYLVKLRSAEEYFLENPTLDKFGKPYPVDIWNSSVAHLNDYPSVSGLNESWPVLEDNSSLIDLLEDEIYAPLFSQARVWHGQSFVPLIPADLYKRPQFYIKSWDFLIQQ